MAEVSDAAKLKACELTNKLYSQTSGGFGPVTLPDCVGREGNPTITAFARYIQQVSDAVERASEEAPKAVDPRGYLKLMLAPFILPDPVDPLLIEARAVCQSVTDKGTNYTDGTKDEWFQVRVALAALKRGMDLGDRNRNAVKAQS